MNEKLRENTGAFCSLNTEWNSLGLLLCIHANTILFFWVTRLLAILKEPFSEKVGWMKKEKLILV